MAPSPNKRAEEGEGPPPTETAESGLHQDVETQRQTDIWTTFLGIRAVNAIFLATFFQPDEFYQALEPAWQLAFGPNSGACITWEWKHKLRSSLHPWFYAAIYKGLADLTKVSRAPPTLRAQLLLMLPKAVQAGLAALTDFFTWQLAERLFGLNTVESSATIALTALSPWNWFVSTRTFSNGLETTLTAIALFYWPWNFLMTSTADPSRKKDLSNLKFLFLAAGFACVLRPTNIFIWLVLTLFTLPYATQSEFTVLLRDASIYGSVVLGVAQVADKQFYGEWVFAPARWVSFNLNQNLAVHYGVNRLDYYFTEGLPILLTTALPFAAVGVYKALRGQLKRSKDAPPADPSYAFKTLAIAALTTPVILSAIAHKEVRFLYPLLPIFLVLASKPLANFFHPFPLPTSNVKRALMAFIVLTNITMGFYTFYIHNRAVMDVPGYLRRQFEASNPGIVLDTVDQDDLPNLKLITAGFLMPCHSTPWRSVMVYRGIDAWALTCEPPIDVPLSQRATYLDEADQFYTDPELWLQTHMAPLPTDTTPQPPTFSDTSFSKNPAGLTPSSLSPSTSSSLLEQNTKRDWPQYLIFYAQLEPLLSQYLRDTRYEGCWRSFNTHWHDDWRRQGDVVVYCKDLHRQAEGKRDKREVKWIF